jgi:FkbM family methyltransferase
VIDLGASIGAFVNKAYDQGSRNIWAYEACPDNYEIAMKNTNHLVDGLFLVNQAVMGSFRPESMEFPVGNNSFFIPEHEKKPITTRTLDDIIGNKHIRYLKIDIEGAEWEVLYTCTKLDQIQEIKGEYHEPGSSWWDLKQMSDLPDYTWQTLERFLQEKGFQTAFIPPSEAASPPIRSGGFHAWKSS